MEQNKTNTFLSHHGILGQRWGVRRYQNEDGSLTAAGLKRLAKQTKKQEKLTRQISRTTGSEDYARATALRKNRMSDLSNEELKQITARLSLEKNYKELTKKQVSAGRKIVNSLLVDVGTNQAKRFLNKVGGEGTDKFADFVIGKLMKK